MVVQISSKNIFRINQNASKALNDSKAMTSKIQLKLNSANGVKTAGKVLFFISIVAWPLLLIALPMYFVGKNRVATLDKSLFLNEGKEKKHQGIQKVIFGMYNEYRKTSMYRKIPMGDLKLNATRSPSAQLMSNTQIASKEDRAALSKIPLYNFIDTTRSKTRTIRNEQINAKTKARQAVREQAFQDLINGETTGKRPSTDSSKAITFIDRGAGRRGGAPPPSLDR